MNVKPLSTWKIVLLHLIPGVFIAAVYYLTAPIWIEKGFPAVFALSVTVALILVPFEILIMVLSRKKSEPIIPYVQKVSWTKSILLVLSLVLFSGLVFASIATPIATLLKTHVFSFLPSFALENSFDGTPSALVWTFVVLMLFANIIGPLVEELYFRGFLLSRMDGGIWKSSILNAFLFALYHFWSPWDIIARTIMVIPFSFVVRKTRNVWISVSAHILVNVLSSLSLISIVFGS